MKESLKNKWLWWAMFLLLLVGGDWILEQQTSTIDRIVHLFEFCLVMFLLALAYQVKSTKASNETI